MARGSLPVLVVEDENDSMEAVVRDIIRRSRIIMPDLTSADRLVEAVLLRAIAESKEGPFQGDIRSRLMDMLTEEHRLNCKRLLN
uniref:Response regulatory domain-containing protein n=1 Tax=uncultured prokaryote TaxID=198431 RepID=A0A0H5QE85_9ZZZZ|nr:hypothetical protein [uncultured prokaryote]